MSCSDSCQPEMQSFSLVLGSPLPRTAHVSKQLALPVGAACCSSLEESLRTKQSIVNTWCCRCWEVACKSRWAHVTKLRSRSVAGEVGNNFMSRCLRTCKCCGRGGVDVSLESQLVRQVSVDECDFCIEQEAVTAPHLPAPLSPGRLWEVLHLRHHTEGC